MDNQNHVLSKLVTKMQEAGREWADAKEISDGLEEQTKNILAKSMTLIEEKSTEKSISETKLERLARSTDEFGKYVEGACVAKAKTLRLKVKYDSLIALFEAKRSELSFEREKVAKGIYHTGRG